MNDNVNVNDNDNGNDNGNVNDQTIMKAKTLAKAKELEDDIRAIRMAMTESSNARHFAMLENYAYDARRQNLPKWLTPRIMVVLGEERKRLEHELETLTDDDNEEQTNFAPTAECIAENMKQLGKAINQMGVKVSDLDGRMAQTSPKPIGHLEHEETKTRIPVFRRIGWFHRCMLRWCFGVKYTKED